MIQLTDFPTGVCVQTESGFWYINKKFRHRLLNRRVMKSWSFPFIAKATDEEISGYFKGRDLGYRDGTLVRDVSDGVIYLISGREKRVLASEEAYERLGLKRKDASWASKAELESHETGEDIV